MKSGGSKWGLWQLLTGCVLLDIGDPYMPRFTLRSLVRRVPVAVNVDAQVLRDLIGRHEVRVHGKLGSLALERTINYIRISGFVELYISSL